MTNADAFDALPLRQRKFARTKLGLLEAAMAAIRDRPLDEVTVRELCEAVEISPAGFFNYFPKKTDLLVYYVQLWSIEMAWHGRRLAEQRGGLAAIEEVFAMISPIGAGFSATRADGGDHRGTGADDRPARLRRDRSGRAAARVSGPPGRRGLSLIHI